MRIAHLGCSLICVASLFAGKVFSQENPVPRRLGCMTCAASAPGGPAAPASAQQRPIVPREAAEVEIALGRLRLVRDRFKIVSKHEAFPDGKGNRSLQVSFRHGQPALRASYTDSREKWSLQFDAIVGAQWTREYTEDGHPVKVVYSQRPRQPIEIEVTGMSAQPSTMSGLSLWHLTKQNPLGFSTCVLPSLERLNAGWNLHETLTAVEEVHASSAMSAERCEFEAVQQWVADLEASDRLVRAAALDQLRQAGLAAHIPLQQTLQGQLSVQQRESIERLLESLEPRSADTPTRLAYWLSGDPAWR